MSGADEYRLAYRDGLAAGREHDLAEDFRDVYPPDERRRWLREGTLPRGFVAGWIRGFRHGLMDRRPRLRLVAINEPRD